MLLYSKRLLSILIICLLFIATAYKSPAQQIPNGDFEDWVIGGGPDLWYTNNLYYPPIECIMVYPDFQAYSGNICAMGLVDSCIELSALYPPILTSFDINLTTKPEALHGFHKYFPIGGDLFAVNVKLYTGSVLVGEGSIKSEQMVADFTEFIVNFEYVTGDTPDMAVIEFTIDSSLTDNQLHQGSKWFIDFLSFGPLSGINHDQETLPVNFSLYQNYPNPFNPSTEIKYQIPSVETGHAPSVQLIVYDILGNEIETLVNEEKPVGSYEVKFNAKGLPSGVYFYQIRAGSYIETKKMLLLK